MMFRPLAAALLFVLLLPSSLQAKVFNAQTFMLDNGMQVVVIPNHRAPVVTHMVWYKTGAADEPHGISGIAHFFEHLMFKGTENMAPGEFSRTVRALGGNDNAFTSWDYTAYFESIAVEHLEKMMSMEADRMMGLLLLPEDIKSERDVILEERRQRTDNNPRALFMEQLRYALFPNHPYGTPIIGWKHEMEALNGKVAREFYEKWYGPDNAILVVSGDVSTDQVKDLAEKTYGQLEPHGEIPQRIWPSSPPFTGEFRLIQHQPRVRQPLFVRFYHAPGTRLNRPEALALQVLENIMDGGAATRLYKSLVVEQKLATGVSLSYTGQTWDGGMISLSASPAEGITMEQIEDAFAKELALVAEEGVTETELQDAITRLQADAVYARDSLAGPAMIVGRGLVTGSTLEEIESWPDDIGDVTAEQVRNVAKKYLAAPEQAFVTGYLLPEEKAEK